MSDLMAEIEARMEEVHTLRLRRWRARQAYDRFRVRRPWRWLPRRLRPYAFRLFGVDRG